MTSLLWPKQMLINFIFAATLAFLPGCLPGNGEGIGQPIPEPKNIYTRVNLDPDQNYECTQTIAYLGHGKYLFTDGCKGTKEFLSKEQVDISHDKKYVAVYDIIFERQDADTDLDHYIQTLCLGENAEIAIRIDLQNSALSAEIWTKNGASWDLKNESTRILSDQPILSYEIQDRKLDIDLNSTAHLPYKYAGSYMAQSISCRVLKELL